MKRIVRVLFLHTFYKCHCLANKLYKNASEICSIHGEAPVPFHRTVCKIFFFFFLSPGLVKKFAEELKPITRFRVVVCGPGRAGKSSLINSLVGKRISKKKDSTPGVSLIKTTLHVTEKSGKGHRLRETDGQTHEHLFLTRALSTPSTSASCVPTSDQRQMSTPPSKRATECNPSTEDGNPLNLLTSGSPAAIGETDTTEPCSDRPALVERADELKKAWDHRPSVRQYQSKEREKIHFLDIWDFGGQRAFAFMQQMLLSDDRCQHLITFNGSIPMDKVVAAETFGIGGVEHKVQDLRGQQTYGEVLIEWLDAIFQIVGEGGGVHLVGTHLDKVRIYSDLPMPQNFSRLFKVQKQHILNIIRIMQRHLLPIIKSQPYLYIESSAHIKKIEEEEINGAKGTCACQLPQNRL